MSSAPRQPVSIVCVFNDPVVRQRCLDASIDALRHEAPETEYLPIDNTEHAFTSAGAALNHGARQAKHDFVVFVHQDVWLHSLAALERATAYLSQEAGFGLLGSFGFAADGALTGFIRDRVVLIGEPLSEPEDVDSLDEVLFMTSREQILAHPLSEHPELSWHAYAVEYGLRVREQGLRVAAADLPVTHNSLTINLAKLDVAHRRVAKMHPAQLPVRTTCGVVNATEAPTKKPFLASQRWRYRWLTDSVAAHQARKAAGGGPFVLGDIRLDIDDVIATAPEPFHVFNLDPTAAFAGPRNEPLELYRRDHRVLFTTGGEQAVLEAVRAHDPATATLLTNLDQAALRTLAPTLADKRHLIGAHRDFGNWVILQPELVTIPAEWRQPNAVPLGMSAV